MKNLAIIPARGGSKRIPKKNIKDFLGKPIIAYSIEAAFKSGLFEEVMVSTDDKEIVDIAIKYGAKIPFLRNEETADDYATLAEVINEVIENYKKQNFVFDNVCCILPTAPFVTSKNIGKAYQLLNKEQFDSVRPIVQFSYPIQRALRFDGNNVNMFNPEHLRTRSQDLEPTYHDAGQFYWFRFDTGLPGSKKGAIVIPDILVQDIDTLEDWEIAEFKYRFLQQKEILQ